MLGMESGTESTYPCQKLRKRAISSPRPGDSRHGCNTRCDDEVRDNDQGRDHGVRSLDRSGGVQTDGYDRVRGVESTVQIGDAVKQHQDDGKCHQAIDDDTEDHGAWHCMFGLADFFGHVDDAVEALTIIVDQYINQSVLSSDGNSYSPINPHAGTSMPILNATKELSHPDSV